MDGPMGEKGCTFSRSGDSRKGKAGRLGGFVALATRCRQLQNSESADSHGSPEKLVDGGGVEGASPTTARRAEGQSVSMVPREPD